MQSLLCDESLPEVQAHLPIQEDSDHKCSEIRRSPCIGMDTVRNGLNFVARIERI